eukprot:10661171-Alexandrium_andersonii.AAC.1
MLKKPPTSHCRNARRNWSARNFASAKSSSLLTHRPGWATPHGTTLDSLMVSGMCPPLVHDTIYWP